jgi:hypothetical protein
MSSTKGDSPDRSRAHRAELDRVFALGHLVVRGAAALATVAVVFGPGSVAAAPAPDGSPNRFDAPHSAAGGAAVTAAGGSTVSRRPAPDDIGNDSASTNAPKAAGATDARSTPAIARRTTEPVDGGGPADPADAAGPADGAQTADATVSAKSVGLDAEILGFDATERVYEPLSDGDDVPHPLERPVVVLYGDSLAWEARHAFTNALGGYPDVRVVVRTLGGTAICDWFDAMTADAATLAPGMVVIEFGGNSFTPCMHDEGGRPLSGAAVVDRYARDVGRAIALFAPIGTQVVLAGAPVSFDEAGGVGPDGGGMNLLYRQTARESPAVRYADAGASVLADGRWTITLPCLPGEPCTGGVDATGTGLNVVRAPDGQHFCPASADAVRGVTGDCPVWASGAFRYGTALAQPVADSLDVA